MGSFDQCRKFRWSGNDPLFPGKRGCAGTRVDTEFVIDRLKVSGDGLTLNDTRQPSGSSEVSVHFRAAW